LVLKTSWARNKTPIILQKTIPVRTALRGQENWIVRVQPPTNNVFPTPYRRSGCFVVQPWPPTPLYYLVEKKTTKSLMHRDERANSYNYS